MSIVSILMEKKNFQSPQKMENSELEWINYARFVSRWQYK